VFRAIGGFSLLSTLALCAACGSTAETSVTAPSPSSARCGVQVEAEHSFTADGGAGTIRVTTNRECQWTAQSDAQWVSLAAPTTGQGDGSIKFTVAPNGDPSTRAGTIKVEDQQLQISQEGKPCSFRLSSTLETVDAAGGERTVQVSTTSAQCHWTATASVPWITVASGSNDGLVHFQVAPLAGPPRTGTLTIAGQELTVQQGGGCSYQLGTDTVNFGSSAGSGDVPVSSPAGCAWTASSASDWITVTSGQSGTGPGDVRFTVTANAGPLRTGRLSIAGQPVTVNQGSGCAVTVTPTSVNLGAPGGTGTLQVASAQACAWSATSATPWISLNQGSTGSGNGQVSFAVPANAGPLRQGSIVIGDMTVSVTQASGCAFSVTPPSANVAAGGGNSTLQVTSAQGCTWSATSATSWIALGQGSSGSGNGQVSFAVPANAGPLRQGSIVIGDFMVSVTQASGCTYSVAPQAVDVAGNSSPAAVSVTTGPGCPWNASSSVDWITMGATSGTGSGQLPFTVAANNGIARTGTLTIVDQAVTVSQASLCTWNVLPPSSTFGASGGVGSLLVIVTGPCTWSASSDVAWLSLTAGASGTGNGLVQFTVTPNTGPPRTGSLTIAGQRYEVTQSDR
jgi:hypothetical protein